MTAVNSIRHIYKTAGWSYDENEFQDERASQEHSVLLENDLEVSFHPLSREEFLIYANIFELAPDNPQDNDQRLRHLSKLILKINSEYSVASSVTGGWFRFELYINSAILENDQICYLLQLFLNDCDFLISENKELSHSFGNIFNNIPIGFLMN
ncbi:hypothetical protein [Succinimonas amylolytica]|uniref:hypothetical protein n=1 Tax=Succinimonas amylolytica TaxID=83769 RepID=UPI00037098E4|nr:hypothetical protein [Succinimonas amylolytica]